MNHYKIAVKREVIYAVKLTIHSRNYIATIA